MRIRKLSKIVLVIFIINILTIAFEYDVVAKEKINFKNITIEDGLTQGTVEAIFQDSKGYIWIGTNDGLNRYNGYQFKVYRIEEDMSNSLISNYILDIQEDADGNIWVATVNGISKINEDGEKITNYYAEINKGNLSNINTNTILITKDNEILVGTADGLNIYDKDTGSFNRIFEGDKLTMQYINSLVEDEEGNIWVATENGINKINLDTKETKNFVYEEGNENSLSENEVYKVYYDSKGYIWAGTYSEGACKIDINTEEITRYSVDKGDNGSISGGFVKNFLRDSKGNMWIATESGLSKYDDDTDTFTTFENKVYDRNSLVDNNIFSIIEDKTGLIWLGTYSGISIFNPESEIFHYKNDPFDNTTISDNMVSAIYEDEEGYTWIGTKNEGIDILDKNKENIKNLNSETLSEYNFSDNILDIKGYKNNVFIATDNGLFILDTITKNVKSYNEENGLPNRKVKTLLYDDLGYLWIGTVDGLVILNLKTDEVIDMSNIVRKYSPKDTYISDIYKDSSGDYWIGTFIQGGLIRLDTEKKSAIVYTYEEGNDLSISNNAIRVITEGIDGDIWIGTSLGLNRLIEESGEFQRYTSKDGMANNTVYGILIDDYGNPWCSTNMGISKVDTVNGTIINLDVTDGLQSNEFNGNAFYKGKNGDLLFGGINGFNVINPDNIKGSETKSDLIFDEFKINGLVTNELQGKKLQYDENNIYIEVFLPNYKNVKGIKYYYLLEGADDTWITMDSNVVTLSNLAPGDYKFKVVGRENNGGISDISEVEFTIKPPFWASNNAIFIYIMIVVLVVVHNKQKVKKLDKLVALRTEELSDEMNRNNQLFEKVIQLEKNKNTYLINLSHELRTPLNVIYSTEQLIRELNKGDGGIEKKNLDKYMHIMRNNTKRLLKIINDLIDTSKIEHGSYRVNIEDVDIVYLVEEAALSLREYIEEKDITLIVDPEIEEKIIEADPYEIERCIVNIVSNAAKFTKPGGNIQVVIKDLRSWVRIEISDDGIGIDKKYHQLIFNRFNQVVDPTAETKGGSGLGLTITKKIIDIHQGEIYVESEAGKGSKFVITLPIKQK